MARDHPCLVGACTELGERDAQFLDRMEGSDPQQIFFEGADEALCDAVAFGFTHKRRRGLDAQTCDFRLYGWEATK